MSKNKTTITLFLMPTATLMLLAVLTANIGKADDPPISVTVGTQSPDPLYLCESATCTIAVTRGSISGEFGVELTVSDLPTGVSASGWLTFLSFGSHENVETATLTITAGSEAPGGSYNFNVTALTTCYTVNATCTLNIRRATILVCSGDTYGQYSDEVTVMQR